MAAPKNAETTKTSKTLAVGRQEAVLPTAQPAKKAEPPTAVPRMLRVFWFSKEHAENQRTVSRGGTATWWRHRLVRDGSAMCRLRLTAATAAPRRCRMRGGTTLDLTTMCLRLDYDLNEFWGHPPQGSNSKGNPSCQLIPFPYIYIYTYRQSKVQQQKRQQQPNYLSTRR